MSVVRALKTEEFYDLFALPSRFVDLEKMAEGLEICEENLISMNYSAIVVVTK